MAPSALKSRVRMVAKGGKFEGTAFIDVYDVRAVDRCTSLHQSQFCSADGGTRRINVREAVAKDQLQKLAERSAAKLPVIIGKAFAKKGKKTPAKNTTPQKVTRQVEVVVAVKGEAEVVAEGEGAENGVRSTTPNSTTSRPPLENMCVECKDCSKAFLFTTVEQEFFHEKGWAVPRQRCKECTQLKKARGAKSDATGQPVGSGAAGKGDSQPDATDVGGRGGRAGGKGDGRGNRKAGVCFGCGKSGHMSFNCPELGRNDGMSGKRGAAAGGKAKLATEKEGKQPGTAAAMQGEEGGKAASKGRQKEGGKRQRNEGLEEKLSFSRKAKAAREAAASVAVEL